MREIVSINGATGYGKSTKAREILSGHFRAVLIDPANDVEWRRIGFRKVGDIPELSAAIAASWRDGFRLSITPPPGIHPVKRIPYSAIALDRISTLLCAYQEKLYRGKDANGVSLVVDEMAECYSNALALRSDLNGFRRVILQGRHFGISIYGITQRPAEVAAQFRDNCERAFYFQLHDATSRARILARIGREHEAVLKYLPKFHYLMEQGGRITRGMTCKK